MSTLLTEFPMPDATAHPSQEQLSAYNLGQLPPDEAVAIESHICECEPCCDTIVSLSSNDTFVGILKEARQLPTDQTVEHGMASGSSSCEDIPTQLVEHPRYEILGLIGKGGMGDVYGARHRMMERTVALKIIKRELMRKPEAVDRFHREVKTAAQLAHPNIVTAHDAEQAGDVHFMVMEFVDGVDLSQMVKDQGALPVAAACAYIRQAAIGLQHAHERGMVHRDVKPHNLMVTADGTVKILDFGLASLAPEALSDAETVEARGDLTAAGAIMGTPDFISPEQAVDARSADIRSDIYSLGSTLYFLLSGQPPFADGSVMHKLKSHATAEPDALTTLRDDVPSELESIIARMTAKNPDERFQSPKEVVVALRDFISEPSHSTAAAPALQQRSNSIFKWLGGAALIAAVAGACVFLFVRSVPKVDYEKLTVFLKKGVSEEPSGDIVARLLRTKAGRKYLRKLDAENPKLAYTEGQFARGYTSVVACAYENRITGVSKPELMLKGWSLSATGMSTRNIPQSFTLESIRFDNAPDHNCLATLQYRTPAKGELALGLKTSSLYEAEVPLDDLIKGPVNMSDVFRKGTFARDVSQPLPGKDATAVKIIATYSGVCSMELADAENPVGAMNDFPIHSQSDFEEFIGRIPLALPAKTNPPPKNDDPLLKKPKIDFKKNMALVLLYPDTISVKPKVLNIRENAKTMWINAEHPARPQGESYPLGMGTYTVVIIPFSGQMKTTRFRIGDDGATESEKNDHQQTDQQTGESSKAEPIKRIAELLDAWKKVPDESEKSKEFAKKVSTVQKELFEKLTPSTESHRQASERLASVCWPHLLDTKPKSMTQALVDLTKPDASVRVSDRLAEEGRPTEPVGWAVQAVHALALAQAGKTAEALKENEALMKKIEVNVRKGRLPDLQLEYFGKMRSQKSLLKQTLLQKALILAMAGKTAESVDASTTAGRVEVDKPTKEDQSAIQAMLRMLAKAHEAPADDSQPAESDGTANRKMTK